MNEGPASAVRRTVTAMPILPLELVTQHPEGRERIAGIHADCTRTTSDGSACDKPAVMVVYGHRHGPDAVGPRCFGCAAEQIGRDAASGRGEDPGIFALAQPDVALGAFVYCAQHMRAHSTGWCSVGIDDKQVLLAEDIESAQEEARNLGLPTAG